jgi:membrane-bound metal-dependent hydrolase YbcI (DUF457 family)
VNGKTHQLVGVTGGLMASALMIHTGTYNVAECLSLLALSSVGSYIPDIDHTGSVAGKRIALVSYPIRWISRIFSWLYRKTKFKLFDKISEMFAHRGIFHSPIFWAIVFIPLFMFVPPLVTHSFARGLVEAGFVGLAIGVILHMLADMLNPTGIPLFMPLFNHKFSIGKIVTGSKSEFVFKVIMLLVFILACGLACLSLINLDLTNIGDLFFVNMGG